MFVASTPHSQNVAEKYGFWPTFIWQLGQTLTGSLA